MLNRRTFRRGSYAPMNMVYRSKETGNQIWLGDYYAATDYNLLKSKGVKSVLTAACQLGVKYPQQMEMNHKIINAYDIPSYKMTPHFEDAYEFIHGALQKGHILVHCAAGISRSTTCVLVYMMRTDGHTFNQALDLVRMKRSFVNPNYGFANELKKFEQRLKKKVNKGEEQSKDGKNSNIPPQSISENEKKAVLNFLEGREQKGSQIKSRLSNTLNYPMSNVLRGQSVNYSAKSNSMVSNTVYGRKNGSGNGNRMMSVAGRNTGSTFKSNSNKSNILGSLNNQFLTFKLETPKIVTIKK